MSRERVHLISSPLASLDTVVVVIISTDCEYIMNNSRSILKLIKQLRELRMIQGYSIMEVKCLFLCLLFSKFIQRIIVLVCISKTSLVIYILLIPGSLSALQRFIILISHFSRFLRTTL